MMTLYTKAQGSSMQLPHLLQGRWILYQWATKEAPYTKAKME